jgi:arsenite methyltransferase
MNSESKTQEVKEFVRSRYAQVATAGAAAGGCCGPSGQNVNDAFAEKLGYHGEELASIPEGANLGLSCGNPVALAGLRPGDVVLDLGSGGGFDCFVAGRKVGAEGRVIGVDMTPEMLSRARAGLPRYRELSGFDNVEFRLGEIEHLPVADASVDVVISNCVLNLSAEKPRVWREIARVLKPGGRVAISDVALLQEIPDAVKSHLGALSSCFAGAAHVDDYRRQVETAGLTGIDITPKEGVVDLWESYSDPIIEEIRPYFPEGAKLGEYAASVSVSATKPGAAQSVDRPAPRPGTAAAASPCCGPAAATQTRPAMTGGSCC